MEESLSHLLRKPTGVKRGWILSMEIALRESKKSAISETTSMRNVMQRFRESASCAKPCPPIIAANDDLRSKPKKRVKRNPYRKLLPPLLQSSLPRKRPSMNENIHSNRRTKRSKLNPYTNKPTIRRPKRSKSTTLPTIEEEWSFETSVRMKD